MSLTVGIITNNAGRVLPDLLRSLADGLASVPSWRLVVADSGSHDDTLDIVRREAPGATILENGNIGFAASVNAIAAADSSSEAIFILSQTARLLPGCAALLLAVLSQAGVGIVVPRLFDGYGQPYASLRRRPAMHRAWAEALLGGAVVSRFPSLSHTVARPDRYTGRTRFEWATGGVTMFSRECLEKAGPWEDSFFLYSEELEFELRARDHGFAMRLVPEATAVHLGGESHLRPELWALLCANQVRVYAMRHGRAAANLFWASRVAGEVMRVRGRPHRAAIGKLLRERRALVRGRPARRPVGYEG